MSNLFWLTGEQMARVQPFCPKSHGKPRVDKRRILSGIVCINRNGLHWCDAPKKYGPSKTLYNRWSEMACSPGSSKNWPLGRRIKRLS
ncbi:transposase [Roseovarius pacificus]|uniref:transposase n=1 Tax=Roseovarius pacificus TaxID=337701 RepID=UPI00227CAC97|nr:transposase [Roseovarius pacificus]